LVKIVPEQAQGEIIPAYFSVIDRRLGRAISGWSELKLLL
jgi:hypothetical protein